MGRANQLVYALNAGGIDVAALARVDLEKMRLAGEHPVKNWLPSVLGPMSIRPGFQSVERIAGDLATRPIPFVRSSTVANILCVSTSTIAIRDGNGVALTVVNAHSTVPDPTFAAAISGSASTGWIDDSQAGGGTAPSVTTAAPGLDLVATPTRYASVQTQVTVSGGDQALAHTVRVEVTRGPVLVRLGTSQDGEQLLAESTLGTGTHLLTVTPNAAAIWIKVRSEATVSRRVGKVTFQHVELGGAGALALPSPWSASDIADLAWDQSIDVVFIGGAPVQPYRIERRGTHSWSVVEYVERNGPFKSPASSLITLTPDAYMGNGTLTSNLAYFRPEHVGGLFELTHRHQNVAQELAGVDEATEYVDVYGVYDATVSANERNMTYVVTATGWTGTWALERSLDADGLIWSTVLTGTGTASATYNDRLSNNHARYRIRVTSYTAGKIDCSLEFAGGSRTGVCRVIGYTSSTSVAIEIIKPFFHLSATKFWREPAWSDIEGWPTVPRFFDGRLWWFRGDRAFASIVDDFDNFDDTVEGDSGPIFRSVGAGASEGARWALDLQRLIVGTTGFEASARSSSFDEPLTPTQFVVRNASTLGVSKVPAVKVDRGAFFVQRSGKRLYEMLYSQETGDYISQDATRLNPGALSAKVKAMAVQRQPDTRLYMVLEDGTCVVLTYERDDKVIAFTTIERISGAIEDVCVIPGAAQDAVFFVVRTNSTQRYIERLGDEALQHSPATCTLFDGWKVLTGSVSAISGATHFAGQTVSVWADGAARPAVAVDGSGNASLGATYARVVYGRAYRCTYSSVKLAYAAGLGSAVGQTKIVRHAGLILKDSCIDGIRVGRNSGNADLLPAYVDGAARTSSQFFAHYDEALPPIPGDWDTDSRIYVSADSDYGPVTVQALVFEIETRDGGNGASRING